MLSGKNPRTVLRLAMLCLLAFFAMNVVARYTSPAHEDLLDGVRGALLGATLGLMLVVGVVKRRGGGTGAARSR